MLLRLWDGERRGYRRAYTEDISLENQYVVWYGDQPSLLAYYGGAFANEGRSMSRSRATHAPTKKKPVGGLEGLGRA